jgi:hypothetical protein
MTPATYMNIKYQVLSKEQSAQIPNNKEAKENELIFIKKAHTITMNII